MSGFEQWSAEHLGQWHYVLGYLIVLAGHNWPLLLSAGLCLVGGWRLYRGPTRSRVCMFFAALLVGIAYEYAKHIAPTLHRSLDTVLGLEAAWLNQPAHAVVGPILTGGIWGAAALCFGWGLWLDVSEGRRAASVFLPRAEQES